MTAAGDAGRQRLDKWLWFARLAKSRTLAQKLVVAGAVRINREKVVDASHAVKVGDTLTAALPAGVRVLRVVALGARRGPAPEARLLYEDLTPPAPERAATAAGPRPSSRDRRTLIGLKRALTNDPT
jgi:ribosome-associated heat shock protein Hsp15